MDGSESEGVLESEYEDDPSGNSSYPIFSPSCADDEIPNAADVLQRELQEVFSTVMERALLLFSEPIL
jgi:hypothetical protein